MMRIDAMKQLVYCLLPFVLCGTLQAQSLWQKAYGGFNVEFCWSMIHNNNNTYTLVGSTSSYGPQNSNIYLLQLNSNGDTLWSNAIGGTLSESGYGIQQTPDSGFMVAGNTYSYGQGSADAFLVKTNSAGQLQWTKTYGGSNNEDIVDVQLTPIGGVLMLGSSSSFPGTTSFDIYIIQTDAGGDTLWIRTYGDVLQDHGLAITPTSDGAYVVTGYTQSFGVGGDEAYLLKINTSGDVQWFRTYGGGGSDTGNDVIETSDGGLMMAGKTHSFGMADGDIYLVRTTAVGDTLWTRAYGGSGTDVCRQIQQTADGGYVLTGETFSDGAGHSDIFLMKIDSVGNQLWTKAYGGTEFDVGMRLTTTNEGYIIAGYSNTFGQGGYDAYFVKTDSLGYSGCNETTINFNTTKPPTQVTTPTINVSPTTTIVTAPQPGQEYGGSTTPLCIGTTGIDEMLPIQSLQIYPNPTSHEATIVLPSVGSGYSLSIYTAQGALVRTMSNITTKRITINRAQLARGLYLLQVANNQHIIANGKLMVE